MYKYLILGILLIATFRSKAQFKKGFSIETSITGDFIKNFSGGITNDFTYIGMEDLCITLDFEAMGLWKGGRVFLHGLNSHGISPSSDIVGDLQVTSNIESGDYTGFYEYYFHQSFGNSSILIGQHDLNASFVGTEFGGTFINSSFGISPTISLNVPVSIYPMAAPAVIYKYEKENRWNYKLGIYDGDPGNPGNNRYNLQPNINETDGALLIGEIEFIQQVNALPEAFKFGGYYHTNSFTNYKDTLAEIRGNFGGYFVSDLVLWSGFNHPESYLGIFIQAGIAPTKINQVDYYVGAGIHLNGIFPKKFEDAIGIGFAYANISKDFRAAYTQTEPYEWVWEFTYKIKVFDHYTVQPNLQYVINPGANPALKNAMVGSIRLNVFLETANNE
jgi:porin